MCARSASSNSSIRLSKALIDGGGAAGADILRACAGCRLLAVREAGVGGLRWARSLQSFARYRPFSAIASPKRTLGGCGNCFGCERAGCAAW